MVCFLKWWLKESLNINKTYGKLGLSQKQFYFTIIGILNCIRIKKLKIEIKFVVRVERLNKTVLRWLWDCQTSNLSKFYGWLN
jgi:hypothetical protein